MRRTRARQARRTARARWRRAPCCSMPRRAPSSIARPPAATARGRAGIGIDATETEMLRREVARLADANRRTLDQIATGVATFAADQKLAFHNAAYRTLWDLDATFLDQRPTDAEVLDRLRDD